MKTEAFIDRIFRSYGEEEFGKQIMSQITSEQVEEARCAACTELSNLTSKYGKQEKGTVESLFCTYVKDNFLMK